MKMRLRPEDEYMHEVEEAESFNESMYFNFYDSDQDLGGFVRIGNRPNEKIAEMTTCLFLPGGNVAFMFARPEIDSNDAFDAGGMEFNVVEPFRKLHVRYSGRVVVLENPLEMADPRRAFTENPHAPCRIDLAFAGVSPMYGGEPVGDDGRPLLEADEDAPFARGHYEQHMAAEGRVVVGERRWSISGYGLRDHSWGPRYWQSPWFYRWLTANFGPDFGFVVSVITSRDGDERIGGMVLAGGEYELIRRAHIETEWREPELLHDTIGVDVETESGAYYRIAGSVMNLIPLRNRRRDGKGHVQMTRISEGMTRWQCNGRTGYGLSEYLDQVINGRPVGVQ